MEFKKNQTIYMQIADFIRESILTKKWPIGEKIASVREMAANIQVNPNTIMRTYTLLQEQGIIENKRGIGYFVSADAPDKILKEQRDQFLKEEVPEFMKKLKLLKVDFEELKELYEAA